MARQSEPNFSEPEQLPMGLYCAPRQRGETFSKKLSTVLPWLQKGVLAGFLFFGTASCSAYMDGEVDTTGRLPFLNDPTFDMRTAIAMGAILVLSEVTSRLTDRAPAAEATEVIASSAKDRL